MVSGIVVIEGTSADATSGVVELRLYVDRALKRIQHATDGAYSLEWDASGYFYGYHDLRVEATDLAGFRSSATVRVFHAP